jgi:RND superfamily putative drug exporter
MHLAGPAMWWLPSWLDKRLPHLHIERPEDVPAEPERELAYR